MHRPVTRSYSRDHNSLVSEQVVMADFDRLAERVHVLEQKMTESQQQVSQEIRGLHDSIKVMQLLMESQFRAKEKNHEEALSGSNNQHLPETSIEQQGGNLGSSVVSKYSRLEFPSYNGIEDPLG